jgi:hypothetical protein
VETKKKTKKNLSEAFFLLNPTAFFMHQTFEPADGTYRRARNGFSARKEYRNMIRSSIKLFIFDSWEHVLERISAQPLPHRLEKRNDRFRRPKAPHGWGKTGERSEAGMTRRAAQRNAIHGPLRSLPSLAGGFFLAQRIGLGKPAPIRNGFRGCRIVLYPRYLPTTRMWNLAYHVLILTM